MLSMIKGGVWSLMVGLVAVGLPSLKGQGQEPTVIATLDLGERLQPGVSTAWSPSGQAAWDELRKYHGVKTVELFPPSPSARAMNRFVWKPESVLPEGTVVFGGDDSEARRVEIRKALLKKVGPQAAAMIGPFTPPGQGGESAYSLKSALFVSCISHAPKFPLSFQADPDKRLFTLSGNRSVPVEGFGVKGAFNENFVVLADDLAGSYVLKLKFFSDKGRPESLLLARRPQMESLAEGLEWMRKCRKSPLPPDRAVEHQGRQWRYHHQLTAMDSFWMPRLRMSLQCDYGDLIGGRYLMHEVGGQTYYWQIREAQQLLSFRLDHEGALTQAVFKVLTFVPGGIGPAQPSVQPEALPLLPKHFKLDGPFLAALWHEGAEWPYLACWVDSKDLLVTK